MTTLTDSGLGEILRATGIYADPDHPDYIERNKMSQLTPPFLEYAFGERHFYADGVVFFSQSTAEVRVYTDTGDAAAVARVRQTLLDNEITFRRERQFLNEIGLWETVFLINGGVNNGE